MIQGEQHARIQYKGKKLEGGMSMFVTPQRRIQAPAPRQGQARAGVKKERYRRQECKASDTKKKE